MPALNSTATECTDDLRYISSTYVRMHTKVECLRIAALNMTSAEC